MFEAGFPLRARLLNLAYKVTPGPLIIPGPAVCQSGRIILQGLSAVYRVACLASLGSEQVWPAQPCPTGSLPSGKPWTPNSRAKTHCPMCC